MTLAAATRPILFFHRMHEKCILASETRLLKEIKFRFLTETEKVLRFSIVDNHVRKIISTPKKSQISFRAFFSEIRQKLDETFRTSFRLNTFPDGFAILGVARVTQLPQLSDWEKKLLDVLERNRNKTEACPFSCRPRNLRPRRDQRLHRRRPTRKFRLSEYKKELCVLKTA